MNTATLLRLFRGLTMKLRNETTTKDFGRLTVELWFFVEGGDEQRCMGDVTLYRGDAEFTGSVDRLLTMGTLEDAAGNEVAITARLIDRVEAWAVAEGY